MACIVRVVLDCAPESGLRHILYFCWQIMSCCLRDEAVWYQHWQLYIAVTLNIDMCVWMRGNGCHSLLITKSYELEERKSWSIAHSSVFAHRQLPKLHLGKQNPKKHSLLLTSFSVLYPVSLLSSCIRSCSRYENLQAVFWKEVCICWGKNWSA